jgi:hypothetical protein
MTDEEDRRRLRRSVDHLLPTDRADFGTAVTMAYDLVRDIQEHIEGFIIDCHDGHHEGLQAQVDLCRQFLEMLSDWGVGMTPCDGNGPWQAHVIDGVDDGRA